jgi:Glycosyltransferase family 87
MLLRAPFVALTPALGGGRNALLMAITLPAVAAFAWTAVALWSWAARTSADPRAKWLVLFAVAACPPAASAITYGHPEDLLVTALVVAAALAALHERPALAGAAFGLACASKPWAVVALGPLALLLPRGHIRAAASAALAGAILVLPFFLGGGQAVSQATAAGQSAGQIFKPWQVFWFLGEHGHVVRNGAGEVMKDYRLGPEWTGRLSHPLVVVTPLLVSAVWWARNRTRPREGALALLALAFLLRGMLDTWNNWYYMVPFLVTLALWEVTANGGFPRLLVALTGICWLPMLAHTYGITPDGQSVMFLLWTVPTLAYLLMTLFAPAWATRTRIAGRVRTSTGHRSVSKSSTTGGVQSVRS